MADIELVIKIPEETYEYWKNHSHEYVLAEAIKNGTPLPKGHGRLGDLDALQKEVSSWGMNDYEPSDFTDAIDDAPTVEAIPKADYETCLKADMVAMLTELQLEIEELEPMYMDMIFPSQVNEVIQKKIDGLKGE